jgi:uncharacterized membrane protein (DUF485 family)
LGSVDDQKKMASIAKRSNDNQKKKSLLDPFAIDAIFKKRQSLAAALDFYGRGLERISSAQLRFLNAPQRIALEQQLLFSFYLFSAQYQLDKAEGRRQALSARSVQIKKCARLIQELRYLMGKRKPESELTKLINDSEKHARYLGLSIAPVIASLMLDPEGTLQAEEWKGSGKTGAIKDWMGVINGRRLYWVWGGNLLNTIVSLLPDGFANKQQAKDGLSAPSPVTGYMSWLLYYARFGINLCLLLKHTLSGPWMSAEEAKIPWRERFKTQWHQRKFALLNDSIWGFANMACFLWLTGSSMLGYYGNLVTTVLLLMDVSFSVWRFWEESTQHNVDMARYDKDIAQLREKISKEKDKDKKEQLEWEEKTLLRARAESERAWRYKKYGLINDLVYAVALMVSFSVMCGCLFPPAAMAATTGILLGVVGAVLCFVLTTVYSAVSGGMEIAKAREYGRLAKEEAQDCFQQFLKETDPLLKKQWYLDTKRLLADSNHQERVIHYKKMKLIHAVLIDAMVPSLVFISLMFMPLGIGVAVIAAGFLLAMMTHIMLKRFEPKASALPEWNEQEYQAVLNKKEPTLSDLMTPSNHERFFPSSPSGEGVSQNDLSLGDDALSPDRV